MYLISYEAGIASRLIVYTISVWKSSDILVVDCGGKIGS